MDNCTLLVVDDNPDNLVVMEALLAQAFPDSKVLLARCAESALSLLNEHHVDAALVDVQMPGIDGVELCRLIKSSPETRHVPLILITAHNSTSALRARGLDAGADDFISRPIDNVELGARIRVILRIRRAEDELRRMNAGLQQLVDDRTKELRQTAQALEQINAQLEDKNRELNAIIHATSHDLRSPLVNIQGFSHELERTCRKLRDAVAQAELPEQSRERIQNLVNIDFPECIHYILSSVAKMDRLLVGLLQLSRLGRTNLDIERLDMNETIRDILQTMEFQMKAGGVQVEVGDLPPCVGDPTQVNRVFSNLLDNALKYLDPGRPGKICVEGEINDGQALYRVRDNGIGIAPEHRDQVFEIFRRLNSKTGVPGEGLGLTTVRRLVERHNGRIWVESEPGQGSTFFVVLPKP